MLMLMLSSNIKLLGNDSGDINYNHNSVGSCNGYCSNCGSGVNYV